MKQDEPTSTDIAAAKDAGFEVHTGDGSDPNLDGRWWWSLYQDSWSGVETSGREFDTEAAAWSDAVNHLAHDETLRHTCGGDS